MGVALTGNAAGGWWHRLGELEGAVLDNLAVQGGSSTTYINANAALSTRLGNWLTDLTAGNIDYPTITALQQAVLAGQASPPSIVTAIAGIVPQLLVNMANFDSPLPIVNVQQAFQLLVNEMVAASATINHGTPPAVGAQTAAIAAAPVGNPTLVWSVVDAAGRSLQYLVSDVITTTFTSDVQQGATAGQEPFSFVGVNPQPNVLSWDWFMSKYGNGTSGSGQLVDPFVNNTGSNSGNLTVNGAFFQATTSNVCDNWTIVTGGSITTQGTSSPFYTNGGWLKFTSDGSTLWDITQSFGVPSTPTVGLGGSPYAFVPSAINNTQYAVLIALKSSVSTPAAGVLKVELVDGSGTTVILDDFGTANSLSITLNSIPDTSWHTYNIVFRLPQLLPTLTPYKIRIHLTTALTSPDALSIGACGMAIMQQLAVGNVYMQGFRGSANVNSSGAFPDQFTNAITYTPGKFQKAIMRYFSPTQFGGTPGLIIPAVASGSATIADTLVA